MRYSPRAAIDPTESIGNANGLFQRPGGWQCARQAAGRLTRRSCPAPGAGQHALRGWGNRCESGVAAGGGRWGGAQGLVNFLYVPGAAGVSCAAVSLDTTQAAWAPLTCPSTPD